MNTIYFYFEDYQYIELHTDLLKRKIVDLIVNESKKVGELSVIFCSDNYLLNVNRKYLKHDYYTDIVTFDYSEEEVCSGDLFISLDRVKENAHNFKCEFLQEVYRVVFHGILHLWGYNDKLEDEKKQIRAKEDYYLEGVDFSISDYEN